MVQPRGSRGSVLLIALIVVILIGGLSAAFVSMSYSQSKTTFNASQGESSLNSAEAGLDDCINKLNALVNLTWKGDDATTKANLVAIPGTLGQTYVLSTMVTSGMDFYCLANGTVTATGTVTSYSGNVNGGTFDVTMTPSYIGAGVYYITTHGYHGKEKKGLSVVVTSAAGNSIGDYGLVGKVTLTATSSNVFVDSYKSTLGVYSSQATNTKVVGNTTYNYARDKGNLGSNGDIDVKNGVVFGSATPGPTSTVTVGNATITGATTPATAALDIPSYVWTTPPVSQTTFGTGNQTLGTTGGNTKLYFPSMVTQGSNAGITIKGNVTVYVDGDIGMNANEALTFEPGSTLTIYQKSGDITLNGQTYTGTVLPADKKASNLTINSASTGSIKFNGGADVYANVYAPDASFKQTGTSVFYGKMTAATIDIGGNMTFHRDEDTGGSPSAPPVYKIKSINETNY